MRTYIFTETEKRAINDFFRGALTEGDNNVAKIKHRMKRYDQLEGDVELYLRLKERFRQPSSSP